VAVAVVKRAGLFMAKWFGLWLLAQVVGAGAYILGASEMRVERLRWLCMLAFLWYGISDWWSARRRRRAAARAGEPAVAQVVEVERGPLR